MFYTLKSCRVKWPVQQQHKPPSTSSAGTNTSWQGRLYSSFLQPVVDSRWWATVSTPLEQDALQHVSSQLKLSLPPTAKAPPACGCLHSPGPWCGSALLHLLGGGTSSLENLWGIFFLLWSVPAVCTRAAQGLLHILHLENPVLKPQLVPLAFSCQAFLILRKRPLF